MADLSRREFLGMSALLPLAGPLVAIHAGQRSDVRSFHACLSPEGLRSDPELLDVVAGAGVTHVWIAGFFYGHWPYPVEEIAHWLREAERRGLACSVCNVPLGHPGDALGSSQSGFPITPPKHWRPAVRPDGSTYVGTSLHSPATEENVQALKRLRSMGVRRVFLDDDFRLAAGPGVIGGCFCEEHRKRFLRRGGYAASRWEDLLQDVSRRSLTPILRDWIEWTCDQLTESFRAQQRALQPGGSLGIMIMYLGAEKAGIRLRDYSRVPVRVGELMFDDGSFGTVKGKTDELFSSLFHRTVFAPERCFSETTAFPPTALSARNLAAKLAVSTISDVRNTMFMSGVSPFPKSNWEVLAPAMRKNAAIHARIAGQRLRGPLKVFWGEHSRMVGDDRPFSLPLALGIPFETVSKPAGDGWTFLSDADAAAVREGKLASAGSQLMARSAGVGLTGIPETMEALAGWKATILPRLSGVPYLVDEGAAVLAWYPGVRSVVIWNLEDRPRERILATQDGPHPVRLDPLGIELVEGVLPPGVKAKGSRR